MGETHCSFCLLPRSPREEGNAECRVRGGRAADGQTILAPPEAPLANFQSQAGKPDLQGFSALLENSMKCL